MQNLFGHSQKELEDIAVSLGEKKFRGKQLYNWIYENKVSSLDDCKNLPKSFIEKLKANEYDLILPEIVQVQTDPEDGTQKFLFKLEDGELIEAVLMKYHHGNSLCLSTQVGCNMGCTFCASGKNGKNRDLTGSEIAGQIVSIENETGLDVSNIVLMGMGEPLDNYDEVLSFINIANKELNIGQRHITLSTSGLVDKIYDLADEDLQINLAISLHSPFQDQREKIMPIAKKYLLEDLFKAAKYYFDKTGRRVTYEYTVIKGFNDSVEDAKELKKLIGNSDHHINLIPLNPVTKNAPKTTNTVNTFSDELNKLNLKSTIRRKNGANIDAACGQLRNRVLEG